MSFRKQPTSTKETPGDTPKEGGIVSLIDLAANLDDPLYRRVIGKLPIILEELKSMNATRRQQPSGSQTLRRYIE